MRVGETVVMLSSFILSEGDFVNVTPNHTLVDIVGYDGVRDV